MALVWIVLLILVFFGAYSLAPLFGLDELWPAVFASDSTFGLVVLVAIMLIGGLVWRGFWIRSQKRRGRALNAEDKGR